MSRISGSSKITLIICAMLLVTVTLWLFLNFPRSVVDDAFIFARYSRNLAMDGQLTWNIGEDPVEGYTGILLPLLYALLMKCGLDFVPLIPLIGTICFAGTGLVLLAASRKFEFPLTIIIILIYCFSPFLYRHIFSGMETFVFTFLLTFSIFLFQETVASATRHYWLFSLSLLLLSVTRPEGFLFACSLNAATTLVVWRTEKKIPTRYLFTIAFLFFLPFTTYFFWRWIYYGFPLPNSYYVKSTGEWVTGSLDAIQSFFLSNSFTFPLFSLLALGMILLLVNQLIKSHLPRKTNNTLSLLIVASVLPLTVILFQYARTNLVMNFSHRFFTPFFPLLLLLTGVFLDPSLKSYTAHRKIRALLILITLTVSILPLPITFFPAYNSELQIAQKSWQLLQTENITIGQKLRRVIPNDEVLVTMIDSGAIPYFSELSTIDMGALNDEFLAHTQPAEPLILDYIFQSRPGVFVITSYSPIKIDRTLGGGNQAFYDRLMGDHRFTNYTLVEIFTPPLSELRYFEYVYVRNDLVSQYKSE